MSDDTLNPKDIVGRTKLPLSLFPPSAIAYGALGMLEGQTKYGRNNYRAAEVSATVMYEALLRHIHAWFECEDFTKEGGPHLANALATLGITVDAMVNGKLVDDRQYTPNPGAYGKMVDELTEVARKLVANVTPEKPPKHWDARDNDFGREREVVTIPSKAVVVDDGYAGLAARFNMVLPAGWIVYSCSFDQWIEFMVPEPIPGVLFTQRHAKAHADVLRNANPGKEMRITWDDRAPRVLHVELDPGKVIAQTEIEV